MTTFNVGFSYWISTTSFSKSAGGFQFANPERFRRDGIYRCFATQAICKLRANTSYEQSTLPFGTALNAESSGYSKQVFTSYERSAATGLDYAQNRSYSSGAGRFTSVDPAQDGMNLYAYAGNDPVNNTDSTGLNLDSCDAQYSYADCGGDDKFWDMMGSRAPGGSGGGGFGGETGYNNTKYGGVFIQEQKEHDERISNDIGGNGFRTNDELNFSAGLIGIVQVYWTFGVNGGQWAFQEMEKVFSFGEQVPYYRRYPNGAPEGVVMLDPLDHMVLFELPVAIVKGLIKGIGRKLFSLAFEGSSVVPKVTTTFTVTNDGIVLSNPKYAIPRNFVENPYRANSFGEIINGNFVERIRVDPATSKYPTHYHINDAKPHLYPGSPKGDPGFPSN